ncbi:3-methyl-2-oxobutanoate hydroxymethyltransferase [Tessaracoccus bendigoensis DSM 12906]|uniref:3-methyl-2-oxobutanoate hydroxymethyltransferase n=1 Tax=Tessaracoccus bendigoensis DSM 12906 TaxID=1123357 RepID=A0A1M6J2F3_9ACTN|nr:3-methyl-2-oxobutanoate hydroxymethyltransferase [Tessaracoccus bendigoensis]SHJ40849.1 3-methyl-2-oxobutanoate hydroxymethyltransferase [Tessaracoccus bendigoensis DSM 12906]
MSSRPGQTKATSPGPRVTPSVLADMKHAGRPIVMVTAYDYPGALAAEKAGVDVVLVGDSAAMTVLGHPDTNQVTVDEMLMLTAAVRRGLQGPMLIGDLPYGSYEESDQLAVATARRFVDEAGCDAVKLEGGGPTSVSRARAVIGAGIPVMGHVGLTPQSAAELGGFRAQGTTAAGARRVADEALALQAAGCFSIVFEAIPAALSEAVMPQMGAVVVGIGAGGAVDGQVLVFHDLLGLSSGGSARFVKRYAELGKQTVDALRDYAADVRKRAYPGPEHCYRIKAEELATFLASAPWP